VSSSGTFLSSSTFSVSHLCTICILNHKEEGDEKRGRGEVKEEKEKEKKECIV
jgi:hypothetical protein